MTISLQCALTILFVIPVEVLSQISFSVYGGLATYEMGNLKEINKRQATSLPIESVKINNFDPGLYLGASVNLRLTRQLSLGLNYQHNSTGSRLGQRDYSGFYAFDQIVTNRLIGMEPEIIIEQHSFARISISLMTGISVTSLEMKEKLSVYNLQEESSKSFTAASVPLYGGLKLYLPVFDFVSGTVALGYLHDTGGKFHLKGYKNAIISINNQPVKTGWSGIRINAGIIFSLDQVKTNRLW